MAKISRVADLPDWFVLEKYTGAAGFAAVEWLEQLERRYDLMEFHPERIRYRTQDNSEAWAEFALTFWRLVVREQAPQVRQTPISSPSDGKISEWMSTADSQPIKPVCLEDLKWQEMRDLDAERAGIIPAGTSKKWAVMNPLKISPWECAPHGNAPLTLNSYNLGSPEIPVIQVNLGASDLVLKEAFTTWLKEARAQRPLETKSALKPLYDRWARYGLLPYLDLWIWGMETDTQITEGVFAAAIFPNQEDGKDRLKTTKKWAKSLMRDLSSIRAFSSVEARASSSTETCKG